MLRSRRPHLTLALAASLMVLALSLLPDSNVIVRTAVALPLVLILPGYAVVSAAFPEATLGIAERFALSLGLSLLLCVAGGVVIDWTPWGLRAGSWIALLGGITLVACFVSLARSGHPTAPAEAGTRVVAWESEPSPRAFRLWRVWDLTLFVLAVAISVAAGWAAVAGADVPREGFSQLWMLPLDGGSEVRLGMRSEEFAATDYTVRLVADDTTVLRSERVRLEPGAQWETTVPLTTPAPVSQIEALLYRADAPQQPYRRVLLRTGELPPPPEARTQDRD
jgi:uncharacterized membrane protein